MSSSVPQKRFFLLAAVLAISFTSWAPSGKAPAVPPADLEAPWGDLLGKDPSKIYSALGRFSQSGAEGVSFLAARLRIIPPDPTRLKRLLAELDADDFFVREKATEELGKMGESVEPALRAARQATTEPEVKDRLQVLLAAIEESRGIPMPPGEPLRRLLSLQALEMSGTKEAFSVLEALSKNSPSSFERDEAARVASRLKSRETRGDPKTLGRPPSPSSVPPLSLSMENSIGMKFQYIPWGSFLMGSPEDDPDRDGDEVPQHPVKITKGFYLATTEVTQKHWKTVMGEQNNPSDFKGDDLPIENVSWNDAVEFCRKLSTKEGKTYRLPTEAEWEYACRAGTTTRYNTGDDENALKEAGWYDNNSDWKTHPVGQKKPNIWGLYDMHGNVSEWCQDGYGPYPTGMAIAPKVAGDGARYLVSRGGCWVTLARIARSAFRGRNTPGDRPSCIGIRPVMDP